MRLRTNPAELFEKMVAIPSVSGEEAALAGMLAAFVAEHGVAPTLSGNNLWAQRGAGERILLFNSHLDTVPPAPGWDGDPWKPRIEEGCLVGLGSHDAKGSVAAQLVAFLTAPEDTFEGGRIFWTATCQEETGGAGFEVLVRELPPVEAGVIGEPTGLVPASCQRGLLRLRMHARGRAAHASRPHQGENAIHKAARAIEDLRGIELGPEHPFLGRATAQVTKIEGGLAVNVLPDRCTAALDARTTPLVSNEELLGRLRRVAGVEWEVVSNRFGPIETPRSEKIVQAALDATGAADPIGFLGVSDRFWLGSTPAVILGPGDGTWSHKAGERLALSELQRAIEVYGRLIRAFFAR